MKNSLFILFFVFSTLLVSGQSDYLNLNRDFNRNIEKEIYSSEHRFHTSIQPYYIPEIEQITNYDSIKRLLWIHKKKVPNKKWKQKAWDKFLNDDVITLRQKNFEFVINPLMDFSGGRDFSNSRTTWVNTRGVEVKGRIGKVFRFYTDFYENQAKFPEYVDEFIKKNRVVPGQGLVRNYGDGGYDYSNVTGYFSIRAGKYFDIQFGHGKNFYGDGYRSLLMSDNSFNNVFLKLSIINIWHLKYQVLYNQYVDVRENIPDIGYPRKYSTTHYLSWAISKRVNLSFFDAIVWQNTDSTGHYRGFDIQYLNPIIFLRPLEFSVGSPDNALLGLNLSVIVGKHNVLYGQLILDEFKLEEVLAGNGWWGNKQGFQIGFKTYDPFRIKNLYFQTEYNWVRPYTYSQREPLKNYGHYNQPIAHPFGANFWEYLVIIKYNYKRLFFNYEFLYSLYGDDPPGENYGKDIYKDYNTRVSDYGNYIGQGIKTNLIYNKFSVSYLINPAYNLNIVLGYVNRQHITDAATNATNYVFFGLRTSLRNLYYDF